MSLHWNTSSSANSGCLTRDDHMFLLLALNNNRWFLYIAGLTLLWEFVVTAKENCTQVVALRKFCVIRNTSKRNTDAHLFYVAQVVNFRFVPWPTSPVSYWGQGVSPALNSHFSSLFLLQEKKRCSKIVLLQRSSSLSVTCMPSLPGKTQG